LKLEKKAICSSAFTWCWIYDYGWN